MKKHEFWRLSIQNVFSSPVRSVLTVLGMAIGVGAILTVITLGDAGRTQVKSEMSRLGIDKVRLTAKHEKPLYQSDAEFLRQSLQSQVEELVYLQCDVRSSSFSGEVMIVGCSCSYFANLQVSIIEGEQLNALQWQDGGEAALVGAEVAKEFCIFPGEWFSLGGRMFRCAGIMGQSRDVSQLDMQEVILLPADVMAGWFGQIVHELSIDVPESMLPDLVAVMASDLLYQNRGVESNAVSMQLQAEAADNVLFVFVDVLKWVALVCMIVGGIGVMNILLVSVGERRREIGIMQSLGMNRCQICLLFLCEASLYAVVGGFCGVLFGIALIHVAGNNIGLSPIVNVLDCVVVFLATVAMGLVFGVLPAAKAGSMQPVAALRDD